MLDPSRKFQSILGFGASMTDAAPARERLFRELFHPSEMRFSVCRVCLGSGDYATEVVQLRRGRARPGPAPFFDRSR